MSLAENKQKRIWENMNNLDKETELDEIDKTYKIIKQQYDPNPDISETSENKKLEEIEAMRRRTYDFNNKNFVWQT